MEVPCGTIHILPGQEVYPMVTFQLLRDDNAAGRSRGGLFFYVDATGVGGMVAEYTSSFTTVKGPVAAEEEGARLRR